MEKTNSNLVAYVKAKVGCYYWFGTFGQLSSQKGLLEAKRNQYPKYYTASDFQKQVNNPKQVFDCSGLIKAFLWTSSIDDVHPKYDAKTDYGATAFYNHCSKKGRFASFDHVAGRLVFKGKDSKMSHVGVYIGNGKVVEAKGHAYGVVISDFNSDWTHWGQCNLIAEDSASVPAPAPQPAPAPAPTPAPAPSAYNYKVKTNGSILRLRAAPNDKSAVLANMPNGSKLKVDRSQGGWMHAVYNGKNGWAYGKWLTKI